MRKTVDTSLTLEQLEGVWGEIDAAPTNLVKRCILASKIPLRELTSEHLRLLIGQRFSLNYLMPIALQLLEAYPLLAGDLYEGDLLNNVLNLDWKEQDVQRYLPRVIAVAKLAHLQMMNEVTKDILGGYTPDQLGLSREAYEQTNRKAIANLKGEPWNSLVNFLEVHG
jgi:hypothetical protein